MRKEEMRESFPSENKEPHQQGFEGSEDTRWIRVQGWGPDTGDQGGGPVRQAETVISRSPSKHKRTEEKQRAKES